MLDTLSRTTNCIIFDHSHYGRAIINNARILNKDTLNRCIIDQNVYDWFTLNIDGMENLQLITIDDITNIYEMQGSYDTQILEEHEDAMFGHKISRETGIINSDVLKIGEIHSKESNISVYNIHLQVVSRWKRSDSDRMITVSLGNLNTTSLA